MTVNRVWPKKEKTKGKKKKKTKEVKPERKVRQNNRGRRA